MLMWTLMVLALPEGDLDAQMARVTAAYREGGTLCAQFTHTYHDSLRQRLRPESGRLWVGADGQVLWRYLTPERKDFVFDGETAYFYEPRQAQVTVLKDFRGSPLAASTEFLWGRGELRRRFTLGACEAAPPAAGPRPIIPPEELCVRLVPRTALPQVREIFLGVDEAAHVIRRSWVVDPVGNATELAFFDVRFGQQLDGAMFHFTPPPGTTVLTPQSDDEAARPAPARRRDVPPSPPPRPAPEVASDRHPMGP